MPSKSPSEYTQQEVAVWLNSIGLGSKIDGFKENAIDGAMLVTLTPDDLTGDLGFSSLQVRKFQQSLEFANSLAEGGGGGGDPEKLQALEEENQRLKQQITDLKMKNKELYEKLSSSTQSAPVPAPPPPQAYSHPPPQTHRAPAPAPRPAGAPVIRGAAGGATVSWPLCLHDEAVVLSFDCIQDSIFLFCQLSYLLIQRGAVMGAIGGAIVS